MGRTSLVALVLLLLASGSAFAVSGNKADSVKKLAQAASDHGIAIDISALGTKVDSGVTCKPMTDTHVVLALPVFIPELNRYPDDFFGGAGIQRMVLCGDLVWKSKTWAGLAIGGTFYLSLKNANVSAAHAARTVHHEIFHLVDNVDEGEWSGITGMGAFISDYAKTGPREDRAELFSEMMMNRRGVNAQGSSSRPLKQKTELLDKWVKANFPALHPQLGK